jgi:methylenetetrahydrofolate reductase (NADPH)
MQGARLPERARTEFLVSIEVMPPRGDRIEELVASLGRIAAGSAQYLNVADSPMARPRMSPTVVAGRLQAATGLDAILHLTVRDRNRVALESEILGARAMGVEHIVALSGDPIRFCDRGEAVAAGDMSVADLIRLGRGLGQCVGAVFDGDPARRGSELAKLTAKLHAGAEFLITQPVYSEEQARGMARDLAPYRVPVLMGILPLYSSRHARFLHENVPGVPVPEHLRERMDGAEQAVREGVLIARDLLRVARAHFQGACVMPPFGHYEMAAEILQP